MDFRDNIFPTECTWNILVHLLNGKGDVRVIGIMEVLWKTVSVVINRQIGAELNNHNVIHGLRAGLDIGKASFKSKLLQQLKTIREEVLFKIFLE